MMEMIESFTVGMTKDDFIEDYKAHYAVIRAMEVMGEAAKNVPPEIRQRHPEATAAQLQRMLADMLLGSDLAEKVYGHAG